LPTISKLLELILTLRLRDLFHRHKVIPDHQSGFVRGRSTWDQTFRLSQFRAIARLRKEKMIAVLLDFEGAFNAVWHNGLRIKLRDCKVLSKTLVRWLSSFLSGRTFKVRVSTVFSKVSGIGSGVPQGSALSPILFAFFTADMIPDNSRDKRLAFVASYADDVLLFALAPVFDVAKTRVRESLGVVEKWSRRWRLPLSPTKCQVIPFGDTDRSKCQFWIGKQQLPVVDEATYLGVKFDSAGTWIPHFNDMVAAVKRRLFCFRRICSRSISFKTRRLVYLATIRPKLEYACAAWVDASCNQKNRLIGLQNDCLRSMLGISKLDKADEVDLCRRANIPQLETRWKQLSANFATRALGTTPPVGELISDWRGKALCHPTPLGFFRRWVTFGPRAGGITDM
jgi:hypothetical protein